MENPERMPGGLFDNNVTRTQDLTEFYLYIYTIYIPHIYMCVCSVFEASKRLHTCRCSVPDPSPQTNVVAARAEGHHRQDQGVGVQCRAIACQPPHGVDARQAWRRR